MKADDIKKRLLTGRKMGRVAPAARAFAIDYTQDDSLGPLAELKGVWTSPGQGWNLIALPFKDPTAPFDYRLLMNQYSESLEFSFVDENIPNRGINPDADDVTDQLITGLDYQQVINQLAAMDSPESGLRSPDGKGIHHEPGLFLHIMNKETQDQGEDLTLARLASVPHGDSVLAMGKAEVIYGPPVIPDLNALPVRVSQDLQNNPYLGPYKHFEDNPFFGNVPTTVPGFPGFFSTNANAILQFANPGAPVIKTTVLHFDTKFGTGGIVNIPFIVKEANATEMVATFWIMEVEVGDASTPNDFIMQYSQTVFLDFFPSRDDPDQLIRWPHVSINTLKRA